VASSHLQFRSRPLVGFLVGCGAAVCMDVATLAVGAVEEMALKSFVSSGARIPSYGRLLLSIGSWVFQYRIVLVGAAFVVAFVVTLMLSKGTRVGAFAEPERSRSGRVAQPKP